MSARVLVVDDNRELAENLGEILQDEGCEVALAHSGEEALALAADRRFDLVLTDIRMPGISGVELVRRMSARDPQAKFLLMTAYTSEPLLREARTYGAVRAVLAKPLIVEQLLELLPREAGTHVLIVEDDTSLATMLAETVRADGYHVDLAASVAEARAALARRRPDIAVVDVKLPDGDGLQLARELSDGALPVVVITGVGREAAETALGREVPRGIRVLAKPFATETLLWALQAAVAGET